MALGDCTGRRPVAPLIGLVPVVVLGLTASATAQSDDPFMRIGTRVEDGSPIAVADTDGLETIGHFESVDASGIRLRRPDGAVEIERGRVVTIRRNGDPLWNGVLWGGLWGSAAALSYVTKVDCQTCSAWEAASVFLVVGGGGAGLGALLDRSRHDRSELYRRLPPAPASVRFSSGLGATGSGVSFTWRF